jgi:hypothetical protein
MENLDKTVISAFAAFLKKSLKNPKEKEIFFFSERNEAVCIELVVEPQDLARELRSPFDGLRRPIVS